MDSVIYTYLESVLVSIAIITTILFISGCVLIIWDLYREYKDRRKKL